MVNISVVLSNQNSSVKNFINQFFLVFLGSFALSISTYASIPTYPVPFTLQSMVVMLLGVTLGRKLAVYAVLLFISKAFFGLPVTTIQAVGFSLLGASTFGYIIGFIFAAYISGLLKDFYKQSNLRETVVVLLLANQTIFFFGVLYLSCFLNSLQSAFIFGYLPFILFDLIKVALVVLIFSFNYQKQS